MVVWLRLCPSLLLRRYLVVAQQTPAAVQHTEELLAIAFHVLAAHGAGERGHVGPGGRAFVFRVAQEHAELGDRGRELGVRAGLVNALSVVVDARGYFLARWGAGILVTDLQRGDGAAGAQRLDFVERRHGVAGAELAGVLGVVGEVLVVQRAVLVADLAIRRHGRGIERELYLDIVGDGDERTGQLTLEDFLRLVDGVEIEVVPVALVG